MEFSKKLYELRKQKGLSQDELASKLNVSRQTISKWELGESTPDMEKLTALSDFFNITLDELVLGKVVEKESSQDDISHSVGKVFSEKVFTKENKLKSKKVMKKVGIVLAVVLGIDIISLIIYFIVFGAPQ